jgi:hypothetical protein
VSVAAWLAGGGCGWQAEAVAPGLGAVNAALRGYRAAWDAAVDAWLVVRIGDPAWVFGWRLQAEEAMRAGGKPGMTDAQVGGMVGVGEGVTVCGCGRYGGRVPGTCGAHR